MGIVSSLGKYFLPGELQAAGDYNLLPQGLDSEKKYVPGKQQMEEIAVIARWLVRLRWIAICGFLVLTLSYSLLPRTVSPEPALYGLCLVLLLYNSAFFLIFQAPKTFSRAV